MTVAENVRSLAKAARPAIRAWLDAAAELKEIRQAASDKGLDWTALKTLLVAQERDADDGGERLKKLLAKIDRSTEYADMIVSEKFGSTPQSNPAPVPASPDTPDRDGAEAESQASPSPEGASATKFVSLEAAAGDTAARSPDLSKGKGRKSVTQIPAPAAADRGVGGTVAAIASPESEPAESKAPIRCGGADPDREAGLHAGSPPLSSDPLDIRNTPMWRG